ALDEATGDVYVSDMLRNAIYRLPGGSGPPEVWLESPDLDYPNGLLVDGGGLMVASWGQPSDPGGSRPEELGRILGVDLATKAVAPLGGMDRLGRMDGIEKLGDAYLATDNPGGRLVRVAADGSVEDITTGIGGAADIGLRSGDRITAVPLLGDSVVRFIDVP
ncbi:MAG: SMP-30/gluconolactonase/LRE family protein, partial [Acidimicrobiia bacterium]